MQTETNSKWIEPSIHLYKNYTYIYIGICILVTDLQLSNGCNDACNEWNEQMSRWAHEPMSMVAINDSLTLLYETTGESDSMRSIASVLSSHWNAFLSFVFVSICVSVETVRLGHNDWPSLIESKRHLKWREKLSSNKKERKTVGFGQMGESNQ